MQFPKELMLQPYIIPAARIAGHYLLALAALVLPDVGDNRFIVAGLLAFVFGPLGLLVSVNLNPSRHGTVDPLMDMITLLIVVALLPELWFYGLLIGVMLAFAPSIALSRHSFTFYAANCVLLVTGMSVIGWYHDVKGWLTPVAILGAIFPSAMIYAKSLNLRTQEMRAKAQSLSALQLVAGGVAHDFNNILTGIAGYTEIARSVGLDAKSTETALTKILGSVEKAKLLTDQLTAFAGDKKLELVPLNICEEILGAAQMVEGLATEQVQINIEVPGSPLFIEGDAAQISRVVLNLAVNAIEAMEEGGVLTIKLRQSGDSAHLVVTDEGKGIDKASRKKIFEPFVSSKQSGRGLGLAVVKAIVEDHHGSLELASRVGVGTTFTVSFPLIEAPESKVEKVENKSILIADDERPIRAILRQLFENEGYKVCEAEDGLQFSERFASHKAELCAVVLDVKMPGKSGWQCLAEVREVSKELPVLMISGYDPEGASAPDPAMRFVAKPFRIAEIQSTFRELVAETSE